MKNGACYVIGLLTVLPLVGAMAQQPALPPRPPGPLPGQPRAGAEGKAEDEGLTRFNLNFDGGSPRDLVAALEKAMGRPVNVIVPQEFENTEIPRLKMNNVTLPRLFSALEAASPQRVVIPTGRTGPAQFGGFEGYQTFTTSYGFKTQGKPSDDSIWCFYVEKPSLPSQSPQELCRFYSLAPYLEQGTTVDDITTAINTGAKMLGAGPGPQISFHKDTKLLIAVGTPAKLEIVDAALRALSSYGPGASGAAGYAPLVPPKPKPAAEPKGEK